MSVSNLKNHDFRSIRQTNLQKSYIRSSQAFFSACQLVKITTKQKHVFSENVSETSGKSGHGGISKIAILRLYLKMLRV